MKILMLSTDKKIFDKESAVRGRILEYGKLFEELHLVIYTKPGQKSETIGNIFLEPTNSRFRSSYFLNAFFLGKKILQSGGSWAITSQDPFETGLVAYLLKKVFRVPFQAQVHTDFLSPYFSKSSLKNHVRVFLGSWLIKKADRIRVVSERIKQSLVSSDGDLEKKITVLPIFVDRKLFRSEVRSHSSGKFTILTVARRASEKNLSLASGIIDELKNLGHEIEWLLISDKPSAPYYKMADLFLLTSNYEGYGMAAVEAAASGIPVVMTDVGVALGATFPVGDKKAAVALIDGLIKDPDKRQQIIKKQEDFLKNLLTREQYLEQYKKGLTF